MNRKDAMKTNDGSTPIERFLKPVEEFAKIQSSGGLVLLACAIAGMALANSRWSSLYEAVLHANLGISAVLFTLAKPVHFWINDGLMAVFFFVVGLEIKREMLVGELSRPRQAMLPIAGALGGMLIPAGLYVALNHGGPAAHGWGVPMATDIAFAIGVMALLGSRVPAPLKVFLTALAIVDDLGAVLVIALFYTTDISFSALGTAAVLLLGLMVANRMGVRTPAVYAGVGVLVWLLFLASGVHATVAGVLVALTVPARVRLERASFITKAHAHVHAFADAEPPAKPGYASSGQLDAIFDLERTCERAGTPLSQLEHALHPWVSFGIMPLFALANSGVRLGGGGAFDHPLVIGGVVLGLVIGKPLGIVGFTWVAIRAGLAERPAEVTLAQLVGVACLGGIGFTMALFIAALAFDQDAMLATAKVGVLSASLLAALAGSAVLARAARKDR
jgi:Na+:H+ antiporter, NhaA family